MISLYYMHPSFYVLSIALNKFGKDAPYVVGTFYDNVKIIKLKPRKGLFT